MEIRSVNNRQVILCVHCNGDGVCKHSKGILKDISFNIECDSLDFIKEKSAKLESVISRVGCVGVPFNGLRY